MLKEKQLLPIRGMFPIVLISFLFNFGLTLLSPIYPLFIRSFVSSDATVGYIVSFFAFVMACYSFLISGFILKHYKKITLLKVSLLGFSFTLLALAFITNIYEFFAVEFFRSFFLTSVFICSALLIREAVNKKNIGKAEGLYFTIANIAWMVGPLIGGFLANAYGYKLSFLISALFPLLSFLILAYKPFHEHNHTHEETGPFYKNLIDYFKNRNLRILFLLSMGLLFWITLLYTFMPLFIKDYGLSDSLVGLFLFLIVIPLVFIEVPAGLLADKFGFKKLFFIGFCIMGLCTILGYFISAHIVIVGILVMGAVGQAFIEPLREAYFFEITNKKDETRLYSINRVAIPVGQFIAPFIFSTVLLFSKNHHFPFLVLGILLFGFAVLSLFLEDPKK